MEWIPLVSGQPHSDFSPRGMAGFLDDEDLLNAFKRGDLVKEKTGTTPRYGVVRSIDANSSRLAVKWKTDSGSELSKKVKPTKVHLAAKFGQFDPDEYGMGKRIVERRCAGCPQNHRVDRRTTVRTEAQCGV